MQEVVGEENEIGKNRGLYSTCIQAGPFPLLSLFLCFSVSGVQSLFDSCSREERPRAYLACRINVIFPSTTKHVFAFLEREQGNKHSLVRVMYRKPTGSTKEESSDTAEYWSPLLYSRQSRGFLPPQRPEHQPLSG